MAESLTSFINTSYDDKIHSGRFESSQAWDLTRKFANQIFILLNNVMVKARDYMQAYGQWKADARFLFTTIKSHGVMAEFICISIKNHLVISLKW